MPGTRTKFIPDILLVHLEEADFLWSHRLASLRSPDFTVANFRSLERRLMAHVEGLLVAGSGSVPFLREAIADEERSRVFAGAYTLLRMGIEPEPATVDKAFEEAGGERLEGLVDALSHGPGDQAAWAGKHVTSPDLARAAAAAEVLAFHCELEPDAEVVQRLLSEEDSQFRAIGWRLAALVDSGAPETPAKISRPYERDIADKDAAVRHGAFLCAALSGEPWLLDALKEPAAQGDPEAAYRFALLASPERLADVLSIASGIEAGPPRLRVLGAFGHPGIMDSILDSLGSDDPKEAVAAGIAFRKMTGVDVESDDRVTLPPDGEPPDEFEEEFLDEAFLPDPAKAQAHWESSRSRYEGGARWCCGHDVETGIPGDAIMDLDMESLWESRIREGFREPGRGSLLDFETISVS